MIIVVIKFTLFISLSPFLYYALTPLLNVLLKKLGIMGSNLEIQLKKGDSSHKNDKIRSCVIIKIGAGALYPITYAACGVFFLIGFLSTPFYMIFMQRQIDFLWTSIIACTFGFGGLFAIPLFIARPLANWILRKLGGVVITGIFEPVDD
jgi:hypothetical protein